ncbi:ATP-binding protein [Micromonospora chalcea]
MSLTLSALTEKKAERAQTLEAFAGLSLVAVRDNVGKALQSIGQFGIFEEYTKHDMAHIDAMLETYDWLIPQETQHIMTSAEWLMLTLATYFHDFGMIVTRDEFERRNKSDFPEFVDQIANSLKLDDRDYESHLSGLSAEKRERFLYQEFVRTNHAARIRSWLSDEPKRELGFDERVCALIKEVIGRIEPTFIDDLGYVCESHHRNDLDDTSRYPTDKPYGRTPAEAANIQYIAILLRAADLLHITRDRTPSVAFRIINPKNPISLLEWAKQQPVRTVRPKRVINSDAESETRTSADTLEVHATFTEGRGFFGLTTYLQYAAQELKKCASWARDSAARFGVEHTFPWTKIDTTHIAAKGFVAKQFEFRLDQHKVLDLLTGHTLYNDTSVVVRELVQNGIDAVRLQKIIENDPQYVPEVVVRWDAKARLLTVMDNGTGMTEATINENFLHVGASRYQSDEFKRRFPEFSSISRFGIGVLSCFMISDDVRVLTCHPEEEKAREVTLESVHGQYLMRVISKSSSEIPSEIQAHGTAIQVRVRETAQLQDLRKILRYWIVVPGCDVFFEMNNERERVGHSSATEALKETVRSLALRRGNLTEPPEVRTVNYPGLEVAFVVEWDRWFQEYSLVAMPGQSRNAVFGPASNAFASEHNEGLAWAGTLIEGIRVSARSPGMVGGGVWAMANATGLTAPRTNVARTALERGDEFNSFAEKVYAAYVAHVREEVEDMQKSRGLSLTRAVFEVPYIARAFLGTGAEERSETPHLLSTAHKKLPVYVLEDTTGRRPTSLSELLTVQEFATVDNEIVEGVDSLLSSLRRSVTMREMFDFVGVREFDLPDVPVLRLGRSSSTLFADLFRAMFEVTEIKAIEHSTLECRWRPADPSNSLWVSNFDARSRQRIGVAGLLELNMSDRVWAPVGPVANHGTGDAQLVRISDDVYILNDHPALGIETIIEDTPTWMTGWIAAIVVGAIISRDPNLRRAERYAQRDRLSLILSGLRNSGLLSVFKEESVVAAVEKMSTQILDPRYSWRSHGSSEFTS